MIDKTNKSNWIFCPNCNNKTRIKIRQDTLIKNLPLYCPKCKQENLITVEKLKMVIIKEPDAKTQSQQQGNNTSLLLALLIIATSFMA